MEYNYHNPVMLKEVLSFVERKRKMTYVDMTLGRGGHANEILKVLKTGSVFYGIDRDIQAIDYCKEHLALHAGRHNMNYLHSDYASSVDKLRSIGVEGADFILMDIGVSSPQFDDPDRGFSYRFDSPLDMRMNRDDTLTAYDIINSYDEKNLIRVFRDLGECRDYMRTVKKIIQVREEKKIETTFELVDIIKSTLPEKELRKEGHPAKQFFLGLRYEVNGEIEQLKNGLRSAIEFLNPKGRLVIIAFNSEEDKIVKNLFLKYGGSVKHVDKYSKEAQSEGYEILTRKPLMPTEEEVTENNRAKCSIMRVIERR